jgi:transcriptional regulator with XRE-family HTH domain
MQPTIFQRKRPRPDLRGIGLRIRGLRGRMRQEELATHLGISQGQLSKVESGKLSPTLEIVFGVAMKFRKSLDWLVTGHGS